MAGLRKVRPIGGKTEPRYRGVPVNAHGVPVDPQPGDDEDFECAPNKAEIPPAVPDGDEYVIGFVRQQQAELWTKGNRKLFLHFRLFTPGPYEGKLFYACCSIEPNGKWRPSFKYWRMWVLAAGHQPLRGDRMSTRVFRGKVFRARLRKVTRTDKPGVRRTPEQQYSVVDELLEVLNR